MTNTSWCTGSNSPGAGDLGQMRALQQNLASVAEAASNTKTGLSRIKDQVSDAVWRGSAADAFKSKIDSGFLDDLTKLHSSYQDAATGFETYISSVSDIQDQAQGLVAQITTAQENYNSAAAALQTWHQANPGFAYASASGSLTAPAPGQGAPYSVEVPAPSVLRVPLPASTGSPSAGSATAASTGPSEATLQAAVHTTWNAMQKLYTQMDDLKATNRAKADHAVMAKLEDAKNVGMQNESFWHKFFSWVSEVAKWVGLALLVVAIVAIIIVQPESLAALALLSEGTLGSIVVGGAAIASGVKLVADVGKDLTGGGASWLDIGLDVIGTIPGLSAAGDAISKLGGPAADLVDTLHSGAVASKLFGAIDVSSLVNGAGKLLTNAELTAAIKLEDLTGLTVPSSLLKDFPQVGDAAADVLLDSGAGKPIDTAAKAAWWASKATGTLYMDRGTIAQMDKYLMQSPSPAPGTGISAAQATAQIRQFQQQHPGQANQANQIAANLAKGGTPSKSYSPQHAYPQSVAAG